MDTKKSFFAEDIEASLRLGIVCVNFFSKPLTETLRAGSLGFVNFVASLFFFRVYAGFSPMNRRKGDRFLSRERGQKKAPPGGNRLAQILRPAPGQMTEIFRLVVLDDGMIVGQPIRSAVAPRSRARLRGFPFFEFLREFFHKQLGTSSRPLRGGKEGSACRAM